MEVWRQVCGGGEGILWARLILETIGAILSLYFVMLVMGLPLVIDSALFLAQYHQ